MTNSRKVRVTKKIRTCLRIDLRLLQACGGIVSYVSQEGPEEGKES